jgi:hypothetical protein
LKPASEDAMEPKKPDIEIPKKPEVEKQSGGQDVERDTQRDEHFRQPIIEREEEVEKRRDGELTEE